MLGLVLCGISFLTSYLTGIRSLGNGIGLVMAWGYCYGILRANILDTGSQFIFDAAACGLYLAVFTRRLSPTVDEQSAPVKAWTILLIGWPLLLVFLPVDTFVMQLVGFRFCAFFLPFLLVGACSRAQDWSTVAKWLALLNLMTLVFALLEYQQGVERFFPRNPVTQIVYVSTTGNNSLLRIPSTFPHSHGYGGTMVFSLPFLLWAYLQRVSRVWVILFLVGFTAASLGLFLSATRSNVLIAGGSLLLLCLRDPSILHKPLTVLLLLVAGTSTAYFISTGDERVHRYEELQDMDMVTKRLNLTETLPKLARTVMDYPLGNGLAGSFGISTPYFLASYVERRETIGTESEFVRIAATQGLVGLVIWVGFFIWIFTRPLHLEGPTTVALRFMHSLCIVAVLGGCVSVGSLSAVPIAPMLFLLLGFIGQTSRSLEERGQVGPRA